MVYASFGKRIIALLIDGLVLSVLTGILGPFFGINSAENMQAMQAGDFSAMGGFMASSNIVNILYFALMESSSKQATLGKMAMNMVVTTKDGKRLSIPRALLRYLGKLVSAFILCIGFIMAAFTSKKQGLHDLIASTVVITENSRDELANY